MSTDARTQYDAVATEITGTSEAVRGMMFGMPCLKQNSKAFAGFTQEAMVFKLGPPEHGRALALAGAHIFDPSGQGHPMREWVVVPMDHAAEWPALAEAARRYVAPPR